MLPFSVTLMELVTPKILTLIRVNTLFLPILEKKAPEVWVAFGIALEHLIQTLGENLETENK